MKTETFDYKGFTVEILCKELYMYYFKVSKNGEKIFQDNNHAYCGYNKAVSVSKKFIDNNAERLNNVEFR